MNPAPDDNAAAKRSLGGYDILYELKTGGMGEVLLARKLGTGGFEKLVALKTIRSDLRDVDQLRVMFLDEARLLGRLDHPAIAQVHDFGEDGDTLYLAMEYVAGVRFGELVRREVPAIVAARAMAQVCRGLHAAHELVDLAGHPLHVVHRDVSPENLMLTYDGRVKVLDFGIALMRGRKAPVTEFGTIKGKPPYLAPEQIKNEPVDQRTDIFAAAVVLHEMLTGEQVFDGDSVYAIARSIEHDDVLPPSKLAGELPNGLDEAVLRGLRRDPNERFQTALEMATTLERIADWAGGATLEAYAVAELGQASEEHRVWLHGLVTGSHKGRALRGRPSGVMTARAQQVLVEEYELSEDAPAGADPRGRWGHGPQADRSTGLSSVGFAGKRSRLGAIIALVVGAAIMAIAIFVATRGGDKDHEARRGAVQIDAGVPVDAQLAIDAPTKLGGTPPTTPKVDAAAIEVRRAIAKVPRTNGRRPPKRRRADAGTQVRVTPRRLDAAVSRPVEKKYGYITIAADPFALVRIDGVQIGPTPMFRRKIGVGRHEIKLISPDTGTVRVVRTVTIVEGKLKKLIVR